MNQKRKKCHGCVFCFRRPADDRAGEIRCCAAALYACVSLTLHVLAVCICASHSCALCSCKTADVRSRRLKMSSVYGAMLCCSHSVKAGWIVKLSPSTTSHHTGICIWFSAVCSFFLAFCCETPKPLGVGDGADFHWIHLRDLSLMNQGFHGR